MTRFDARALVFTGVLVLAAVPSRAQPQYQVTEIELPSPIGGGASPKLNQHGDVAGSAFVPGSNLQPFLYTAADGVRFLGLIPDARSAAVWGLNDRDNVLVTSYNDPYRYLVYSGGTPRELVFPENFFLIAPQSIDNTGRVVGYYSATPSVQPFALNGDTFTRLPVPAGEGGEAIDSNDSGQIVGYHARAVSPGSGGGAVARIWQPDGTVTDIMPTTGWASTRALAINDRGQVLGYLLNGTLSQPTATRSFIYDPDGTLTELTPPVGWTSVGGAALNNNGDFIGNYSAPGIAGHLFVYSGGRYTDLTDELLLRGDVFPDGINDAGQILVNTSLPGGERHLLLLTPVPEPSAVAGVLCFLSAALLTRRRRGAPMIP